MTVITEDSTKKYSEHKTSMFVSAIEKDKQALSDITVFNKYAKFVPELNRRENWKEIISRNVKMHIDKYPHIEHLIRYYYDNYVLTKKVLPSMRSLQFGGRPIEMCNSRMFNCAYAPAESPKFFSELMFLLLGGTGMGYSVQNRHISKLPTVRLPETFGRSTYQIQDSIIGWSDAIKTVVKSFFSGSDLPIFDYRDIRDKGSDLITTGGKAPGSAPLKHCIDSLINLLRPAALVQRKLTSLEVHDMACIIADAVLAGGIRRAAMICLFDYDDDEMLKCKAGDWWLNSPYRARANNSVVLLRNTISEFQFYEIMQRVQDSNCGEPGVYWTNNLDWGTNPCVEIALEPYQMCNLTEINAGIIHNQEDLNEAAKAASFIGTLQAGYTDFHYLNSKWKETCSKAALLGVSMTGIASGTVTKLDLKEAVNNAILSNKHFASLIHINPAERVTCIKPAGTTSLVLGVASGIHAWHGKYYIRRMRAGKDEALAQYLMRVTPELVEQDVTNDKQVVLSFPQKAPNGACIRSERMLELLERVKHVSTDWVHQGHIKGDNTHNVSCTISVKDSEWQDLKNWMWINKNFYSGISVLPYYGTETYSQLPFEDCSEEEYNRLLQYLELINIEEVFELDGSGIDLKAELACAGGFCEIT